MVDSSAEHRPTVLLTGFGPFGVHTTNASWEAVQELESSGLLAKEVNLVTREIPVSYSSVKQLTPRLWQQYKPTLCIHVGVSGCTDIVQMESCAHNSAYERSDADGQLLGKDCCEPGGPDCLHTSLNLEKVCADAKAQGWEMDISEDAGRYLCEFIYYTSLQLDRGPVVFVHVPPLDAPYSKAKLAAALKIIILALLKQINQQ